MTDTTIAAILAAIPPTIMAYAALRQSRANTKIATENKQISAATAVKVEANTKITEATSTKVEAVENKVGEVHTLANSNLAKQTAALEVANKEIQGLHNEVSSLKLLIAEMSQNKKSEKDEKKYLVTHNWLPVITCAIRQCWMHRAIGDESAMTTIWVPIYTDATNSRSCACGPSF